jgi:hypothetical protein
MIIISNKLNTKQELIDLTIKTNNVFFYDLENMNDLNEYVISNNKFILCFIILEEEINIMNSASVYYIYDINTVNTIINNYTDFFDNNLVENYIINNDEAAPPIEQSKIEDKTSHELKENYIYIIGGTYRPNIATYIYNLENKILEIDTDEDNEVDIFISTHGNYRYVVCGILIKWKSMAEDMAKELELILSPGRPISSEFGPFELNYSDSYVFTLENTGLILELSKEELNNKIKEELFILFNSNK